MAPRAMEVQPFSSVKEGEMASAISFQTLQLAGVGVDVADVEVDEVDEEEEEDVVGTADEEGDDMDVDEIEVDEVDEVDDVAEVAEADELDMAELDVTELDVAELDVAELDVAELDVAEPDVAELDVAELDEAVDDDINAETDDDVSGFDGLQGLRFLTSRFAFLDGGASPLVAGSVPCRISLIARPASVSSSSLR